MSGVPFLDLVRLHASIAPSLLEGFERALRTGAFVGGDAVATFESAFANAHHRRAAVGCGSGTDALALALRAVGVGLGDEIIVPSLTFVATAEAVVHVGATPVIADVDAESLLLSDEGVRAVRSDRTRAVVPVHLYGHVVPFDLLKTWQREGMYVVEDAAQAHGASWQGEMLGAAANATAFSFYPGKNLGALGDGGAVVSDDVQLIERVRVLRDHGRSTKYEHDVIGWCSRLDALQAAFLTAKLGYLAEWTQARAVVAERYRERLSANARVRLVGWSPGAVHHLLVIRMVGPRRDAVRQRLADVGIATGLHYPIPLSCQPSLAAWRRRTPNAEAAATEVLSLPMDPLMSEAEVDRVCEALYAATRAP